MSSNILSAKDLEALADVLVLLDAGLLAGDGGAEDHHGLELPVLADIPLGLDLLVDQRVVVLQVGPQALGLERRPHGELVHGVGLRRPLREAVGVGDVLVLETLDGWSVFVEEDLLAVSVSGRSHGSV